MCFHFYHDMVLITQNPTLIQSIILLYISHKEPEAVFGGSHFKECISYSHEAIPKKQSEPNATHCNFPWKASLTAQLSSYPLKKINNGTAAQKEPQVPQLHHNQTGWPWRDSEHPLIVVKIKSVCQKYGQVLILGV